MNFGDDRSIEISKWRNNIRRLTEVDLSWGNWCDTIPVHAKPHWPIAYFQLLSVWLIRPHNIINGTLGCHECKHVNSMWHLPCAWNFRNGSTMAKNRSLDKAVNVNTETPMETSLTNSDIVQMVLPHGHDSSVYTNETNGTEVTINSKSASASDKM